MDEGVRRFGREHMAVWTWAYGGLDVGIWRFGRGHMAVWTWAYGNMPLRGYRRFLSVIPASIMYVIPDPIGNPINTCSFPYAEEMWNMGHPYRRKSQLRAGCRMMSDAIASAGIGTGIQLIVIKYIMIPAQI